MTHPDVLRGVIRHVVPHLIRRRRTRPLRAALLAAVLRRKNR